MASLYFAQERAEQEELLSYYSNSSTQLATKKSGGSTKSPSPLYTSSSQQRNLAAADGAGDYGYDDQSHVAPVSVLEFDDAMSTGVSALDDDEYFANVHYRQRQPVRTSVATESTMSSLTETTFSNSNRISTTTTTTASNSNGHSNVTNNHIDTITEEEHITAEVTVVPKKPHAKQRGVFSKIFKCFAKGKV